MRQLTDIFTNTQTYNTADFQKLLDRIIQWEHRTIPSDPESQTRCFNTITYILNNFCNNTKIKKLYNTAPTTTLTEYTNKNIADKILHNIYHCNRKWFYEQNIWWGNCHYRTIVFKEIFDVFKKQWLEVSSKIIAYKNIGWHSFLLVKFQWNDFIVDIWWFDVIYNTTVTPTNSLDKKIAEQLYKYMKQQIKKGSHIHVFDDKTNFAKYIDDKEIKNISLQFKPKLHDENVSDDINIAINRNFINIDTWDKQYIFYIPKKYTIPKHITTSSQFFNDIIQHIQTDSESRKIYNKYIYLIADKINYHKIQRLRKHDKKNKQ